MHPPPETERPAAMGRRERAGAGAGEGSKQSRLLADAPWARKTDRPQTDERLWKSDAVAKERAIIKARDARRKLLPPEVRQSLLIGDQKDRERRRGRTGAGFNINLKREAEINSLFEHRHGGKDYALPDDDAGRDDALLMVHHQVKLASGQRRALNWIEARCPWMDAEEAARLIARAHAQDWTFVADRLAKRLGLTFDLRNALGITTIGSVDVDKAGRKKLRNGKARTREAARRAATGSTPRKLSVRQLEPWKNRAERMSRPEWYRLPKPQRDQEVEDLRQFRAQQDTKYPLGAHEFVSAGKGLAPDPNSPILSTREDGGQTVQGRGLEAAPSHMPECDIPNAIRDIEKTERDIPPAHGDIERDMLPSPAASTEPGRALKGAPVIRAGRSKAVAVLPYRVGWTRQRAMLMQANGEAKGGHQADPFLMFPDSEQRETGPMAMAAWVLPAGLAAGPPPRGISICNIFLQGGA